MDPHMTHYKALRRHMNEHEDKIDALTTEQHEKQTIIDLLKQDLKAVREETARLELAIKLRSKESDQLSNSTKECRRSLAEREESRRALADALRVLKEETKNRSARLTERKLYFEKLVSSTRSELEKWIFHVQSSQPKEGSILKNVHGTRSLPETIDYIKEAISVDHAEPDHHEEGTTIPVATKPRLEETLKELQSQYHELVMITPRLEANLLRLKTEKTAEEEFIVSLTERLTQLKDFYQQIICESCGHDYSIQFEEFTFVVRDSTSDQTEVCSAAQT
ncbi:hypothetical protein MPTK1_5g01780 [Marchantia polymorpha subsp. ruderalis]|uniref:Uncharacterized protein n=2 Tax=Marchantia polymorpha TaxID=3197 RepID=A0AAF6BDW4_MARPO|nr:hypothetical protein MARPO_0161s0026 [Marchantia polymorpha]BBN10198.1 hypothetical protein Mp_5g01780 [Marchantia polymorpha subsp. ruderalis]|eukprot:PTQ28529.1 hypothetical protein MARPO_0161s0026 [Marchantia polymorpha]